MVVLDPSEVLPGFLQQAAFLVEGQFFLLVADLLFDPAPVLPGEVVVLYPRAELAEFRQEILPHRNQIEQLFFKGLEIDAVHPERGLPDPEPLNAGGGVAVPPDDEGFDLFLRGFGDPGDPHQDVVHVLDPEDPIHLEVIEIDIDVGHRLVVKRTDQRDGQLVGAFRRHPLCGGLSRKGLFPARGALCPGGFGADARACRTGNRQNGDRKDRYSAQ